MWNKNLSIVNCDVIHLVENPSDHSPIFCVIDLKETPQQSFVSLRHTDPKPSWKKSDIDIKNNFIHFLNQDLLGIDAPSCINCVDVHCNDINHKICVDTYALNILSCVEKCGSSEIRA